jgi:eukaryotic-like serine/threonine-protein kinase
MATTLACDNATVLMPRGRHAHTVSRRVDAGPADTGPNVAGHSAAMAPAFPIPFGDYELLEEIARGGMGVVFKARQIKLNRLVALKMLRTEVLASPEAVERLQAEAELAAQLQHAGIVPIHDVGEYAGRHYICMAFVDGESLAERTARRPLPLEEAARVVAQVADAIQYAHDHEIIHRDLKPANILLDRAGRARVVDFGLAQRLDVAHPHAGADCIAGTPSYMSPEQARGDADRVGEASDVYALGAILYHLLVGRAPFDGRDTLAIMQQVCEEEPVAPRSIDPSIPASLEAICLRCLQKDPAARFASAGELASALRQPLPIPEPVPPLPGLTSVPGRWTQNGVLRVVQVAGTILLGAAVRLAVVIPAAMWAAKE